MYRRLCLLLAVLGIMLVVVPLSGVLPWPDVGYCTVGLGFMLLGVFGAIESLAKKDQKKAEASPTSPKA